MEFVEEDEILQDIEIREFLSIEKMLEYDPKFVQSSYNEIIELMSELLKSESRARIFADLHRSIINPTEKILTDYTKFKVNIERKVLDTDEYINEYTNAQKAAYYKLQQTQKTLLSNPFNLENTNELENPMLNIPALIELVSKHDTVKIIDEDTEVGIKIPVDAIAWQPLIITDESYLVTNTNKIPSSKFVKWNMNKDPVTLHEWIEKRIEPTFKTTLENHKKELINRFNNTHIIDNHAINVALMHDGFNLSKLTEIEFQLLVNTLEELEKEFIETEEKDKAKTSNESNSKLINRFTNLSKYAIFWDFLSTFKFPLIHDESITQLREQCGNYTMTNNKYNANEESIRKVVPYKMAMNILNGTNTLNELLEHIETYRNIITNNRIKNLLDDSPKTAIEQIDKPVSYIDVLNLIKQFKLTEKSIIPETRKPFLDTYKEIAEFVEGTNTKEYDGTPFVAAQGTYDEDFEMGLVDDILLNIENEKQDINQSGIEDAFDLITSKYNEKYPELGNCNSGTSEVLISVIKQLLDIRSATGIKWPENLINEWIKNINSNDIIKMRMSRAQQIKLEVNDVSDTIAKNICATTEQLAIARIQQIANTELSAKLISIYPRIHKEWKRACIEVLISGLSVFTLDSIEASVKGNLGFNILSGMVMFVNTWSPYGVPLEKENKVGKRGIVYYIGAVSTYLLKTKVDYAEEILIYINTHLTDRLKSIKTLWKTNKNKPVQSRAEQALVSLVELINDITAKKKISRNVIINTFIKSFVYLPLQLPIEDWNKYKKLPAWDLGCCTAKIDNDYSADNDMKKQTKDLYKLKVQLARQRWSNEPRKKYQTFLTKHKKTNDANKDAHNAKDANKDANNDANKDANNDANKDEKQTKKIKYTDKEEKYFKSYEEGICKTFLKPNNIVENLTTQPNNDRFDFIFNNNWFPNTYVSDILKEPKLCLQYANNILSTYIDNNNKSNEINGIINNIKDIGSIINIVSLIIKNLFSIANRNIDTSSYNIYNSAMETAILMKNTLIAIQNKFKGDDYTKSLYFSKYILAIVYTLPGQPIYIDKDLIIDVPDGIDINEVLIVNNDILVTWKNTIKMPTVSEYNDYINKMREESKIKTMAIYNVLEDDDLQLMKDMKRFGFKIDPPSQINPEGGENDGPNGPNGPNGQQEFDADNIQDYEGEREFYPDAPDQDMINEEKL